MNLGGYVVAPLSFKGQKMIRDAEFNALVQRMVNKLRPPADRPSMINDCDDQAEHIVIGTVPDDTMEQKLTRFFYIVWQEYLKNGWIAEAELQEALEAAGLIEWRAYAGSTEALGYLMPTDACKRAVALGQQLEASMESFKTWYTFLDRRGLAAWLQTRPKVVQDLLNEFPGGTFVTVEGKEYIVMGATEHDALIICPVDALDYNDAMEKRQHLHADHLRTGEIPYRLP